MMAVVDASVALKWQFQDEDATAQAIDLLSDFVEGKVRLIAPTLFSYEIVSAVNVAINRKRISEDDGYRAINYLTSLDIELCGFIELIESTFHLARQYGRTPYDCAYMALAESRQCDFITGDRRLFNAMENQLSWVKWVGDYTAANHQSPES